MQRRFADLLFEISKTPVFYFFFSELVCVSCCKNLHGFGFPGGVCSERARSVLEAFNNIAATAAPEQFFAAQALGERKARFRKWQTTSLYYSMSQGLGS